MTRVVAWVDEWGVGALEMDETRWDDDDGS